MGNLCRQRTENWGQTVPRAPPPPHPRERKLGFLLPALGEAAGKWKGGTGVGDPVWPLEFPLLSRCEVGSRWAYLQMGVGNALVGQSTPSLLSAARAQRETSACEPLSPREAGSGPPGEGTWSEEGVLAVGKGLQTR